MFAAARFEELSETKVQSCQLKMSDNAESPTETQKEELHSPSENSATSEEKKKIDVLLKAVGDTPIMKTKKWAVDRGRTVQSLAQFISRFLKLDANEQLFIYVHQSFAPSPDQEVGVLFDSCLLAAGRKLRQNIVAIVDQGKNDYQYYDTEYFHLHELISRGRMKRETSQTKA